MLHIQREVNVFLGTILLLLRSEEKDRGRERQGERETDRERETVRDTVRDT